jgi:hypothetical protein
MRILHGNRDQEALFAALEHAARGQLPSEGNYDCSIQGSGQHFLVILSESGTREIVWEWAGTPEAILKEFQRWIGRRKPN